VLHDGSKEDFSNFTCVTTGIARAPEHISGYVKETFRLGKYHGGLGPVTTEGTVNVVNVCPQVCELRNSLMPIMHIGEVGSLRLGWIAGWMGTRLWEWSLVWGDFFARNTSKLGGCRIRPRER